jgi:voltage-gated potassium channel
MNAATDVPRTDPSRRELLLDRIERLTELPLLALSFIMIPVLVGPILSNRAVVNWELSSTEETVFFAIDALIWAIFAIDLAVKVIVAPERVRYLRHHWLEVLVVAVPFFRPLRIVRLFIFGSRAFFQVRRLVSVDYLLVYALGMVIIAATVVTSVETGDGSSITSFPDALWWSWVTVTTVGYGDMFPVTLTGRVIATMLMLVGIGLFGGLTANLASLLLKSDQPKAPVVDELVREVRGLREEIALLRQGQA